MTESAAVASSRLASAARALARLGGWRRQAAAFACGAVAAAALPPLYVVPALFVAFSGLLWLLDGVRRPGPAFALGWSFGFGHMLAGLYWVGISFLVDAPRFGLIMPFAVAGLAAGIGLFPALAVLVVHWAGWRGPARVALLATAWLGAEWLRSWVLTGFPWNLLGTVWSFSPEMLQLAAAAGVWGLSFFTVLAAAAPVLLAPPTARGTRFCAVVFLLLPVLVWAGGAVRLAGAPPLAEDAVPGVRLRLVQASIAQSLKWLPELRRRHVETQRQLSRQPGAAPVTHVIWPETAVPYLLDADADLRRMLAEVVPAGGLLLTGAPRADGVGGVGRLWNSLLAMNGRGEIVATYDKHHLVPFGEYTPLRQWLGPAKLAASATDFSAGLGPITLPLPGLPTVSPLICYEAIFSGQVTAAERPGWLLNITNDGWFGVSSGPYQHFASARLRAVEEGLPLIRAANSGISAVVDPYGRIIGRLALNRVGVLDASLPRALPGGTLYAGLGPRMVFFLLLAGMGVTLILRRLSP